MAKIGWISSRSLFDQEGSHSGKQNIKSNNLLARICSARLGLRWPRISLRAAVKIQFFWDLIGQCIAKLGLSVLVVETFSKSSSERVPSDCRHCQLTSDIFAKEFFTCKHWIYCYISRNTDSQKLSIDMVTVWRLVEDNLLNMFFKGGAEWVSDLRKKVKVNWK